MAANSLGLAMSARAQEIVTRSMVRFAARGKCFTAVLITAAGKNSLRISCHSASAHVMYKIKVPQRGKAARLRCLMRSLNQADLNLKNSVGA